MTEKYIIRGTNSDLDDLEVAVGSPCEFHYVTPHERVFRKTIVLRQVFSLTDDVDSDLEGVWVEDKFLRVDEQGLTETTVPGKHYRTHTLFVEDRELTLVEYDDRLQISVVCQGAVLLTEYRELKHFGSIKLWMDECQSAEEVTDFIQEVQKL